MGGPGAAMARGGHGRGPGTPGTPGTPGAPGTPGTPGGGAGPGGGASASPAQAARHRQGARRRVRRARRGAEAAAEAWGAARGAGLAAGQALVNALLERRYLAGRPLGALAAARFRDELGLVRCAEDKLGRAAARELAAVGAALAGLEGALGQFQAALAGLRGEEPGEEGAASASPTGATPLSPAQFRALEGARPVFASLPMPAFSALLTKVVAGYSEELRVKRGVHASLAEVVRSELEAAGDRGRGGSESDGGGGAPGGPGGPGEPEGAGGAAGEWEVHLAAWLLEPLLEGSRLEDFCTLVEAELKAAG